MAYTSSRAPAVIIGVWRQRRIDRLGEICNQGQVDIDRRLADDVYYTPEDKAALRSGLE